jgi:hypothetical protein
MAAWRTIGPKYTAHVCLLALALSSCGGEPAVEGVAVPVETASGSPESVTCSGSLSAAEIASPRSMVLAGLCAGTAAGPLGGDSLVGGTTSCGGVVLVTESHKVDCQSFWLFDATTGALRAVGGACSGHWLCTRGASDFRFPGECLSPWGWGARDQLCPPNGGDGGREADSGDQGD